MSQIPKGMKTWTRPEALEMVRVIQAALAPEWAVGLTGSLMTNDTGTDLDLIAYPYNKSATNRRPIHTILEGELGMRRVRTPEEMITYWRSIGGTDTKRVEVYRYNKRRIDVMLLD